MIGLVRRVLNQCILNYATCNMFLAALGANIETFKKRRNVRQKDGTDLIDFHLWFDFYLLLCVFVRPVDVDFTIKVANVANNGVVLHLLEVLGW